LPAAGGSPNAGRDEEKCGTGEGTNEERSLVPPGKPAQEEQDPRAGQEHSNDERSRVQGGHRSCSRDDDDDDFEGLN
jgi:hypothetical protein